jgi:hypothetical protein
MRAAAFLACALALPLVAEAQVCPKWGPPEAAGALDTGLVNEASGLDVSQRFPDRLYHNNDSGDGLRFYVSDLKGANTRVVEVEGEKPKDIEALSLGPCGPKTCLYLADIGDNPAKREGVAFTVVEELESFPAKVAPLRTVRARYPDGAHNAESMAVHPNGDLYVITKPADAQAMTPGPALVYRLTAAQLAKGADVQVFEKVGQIDVPKIMAEFPFPGSIPTSLDIAPDGERALLLTYMHGLELGFDIAKGLPPEPWVAGRDYQMVRLKPFPQQEAAAWTPDGKAFLYDTELTRGAQTAPINRVTCETR